MGSQFKSNKKEAKIESNQDTKASSFAQLRKCFVFFQKVSI